MKTKERLLPVLIASVSLATAQAFASTPDLSSPAATVQSLYHALKTKDSAAAAACVVGARDFSHAPLATVRQVFRIERATRVRCTGVSIRGDWATAAVRLVAPRITPEPLRFFLAADWMNFQRQQNEWRVVPRAPFRGPAHSFMFGTVGPNYRCFPLYPLFYPMSLAATVLAYPKDGRLMLQHEFAGADLAVCEINLKAIAVSLCSFRTDHHNTLALDPAHLVFAVSRHERFKYLFHCQAARGRGVSYTFNGDLAWIPYNRIRDPAHTIMVYEGWKQQPVFRHNGRTNIACADGSVHAFTPSQVRKLRWTP